MIVGHLRHVDESLAKTVGDGLGFETVPDAPPTHAPVREMARSAALPILSRMKDTLEGRAIGILVSDGSDVALIAHLGEMARAAGATVKIVAPRVGGVALSDGSKGQADGQLAGTPSVLFDAVAMVLSSAAAKTLAENAAALEFCRNAFVHLKAIAVDAGGRVLLQAASVRVDDFVVDAGDPKKFLAAAKTRAWNREPSAGP